MKINIEITNEQLDRLARINKKLLKDGLIENELTYEYIFDAGLDKWENIAYLQNFIKLQKETGLMFVSKKHPIDTEVFDIEEDKKSNES